MKKSKHYTDSLIINSITKSFKQGSVKANCDISTTIYPNEVVAIIGHNGAGKTTLLNQIIGIVKPDNGDIVFQGNSFVKNTRHARNLVSMMPQFHAPLSGVTLRQSIEAVLHIRGISGRNKKAYVEEILNELRIDKWANRPGEKLSGGLQRLASFAMAVVCPPPIILLDEPTNDVDPVRRKLVWNYMKKLAKNGHIVIVVTHNLLEVEQYADRYLLFEHGHLIRDEKTGGLNKQFAANTLSVVLNNWNSLPDLPPSIETRYIEEEMQIIFTLSYQQIPSAINWLLELINQRKIVNYRLTSASLDATYGGLADGDKE